MICIHSPGLEYSKTDRLKTYLKQIKFIKKKKREKRERRKAKPTKKENNSFRSRKRFSVPKRCPPWPSPPETEIESFSSPSPTPPPAMPPSPLPPSHRRRRRPRIIPDARWSLPPIRVFNSPPQFVFDSSFFLQFAQSGLCWICWVWGFTRKFLPSLGLRFFWGWTS